MASNPEGQGRQILLPNAQKNISILATMIPASRIITSLALFSLLGACGLKGPLYLPREPVENPTPNASLQQGKSKAKLAPKKQSTNTPAAGEAPLQAPQSPSSDTPPLEQPSVDK